MEERGPTSDAASSGCNYHHQQQQQSSAAAAAAVEDTAAVSPHQSAMRHLHQQLHHPHQLMTEHARLLPPHYASLATLNNNNINSNTTTNNNNNSYSVDNDDDEGETKYHHLAAASLLCQPPHPYHNSHARYQLDGHRHHQHSASFQLDYCNAVPYAGMTSTSIVSACAGGGASRAGYCGGRADPASAAYASGEPRPSAGYWTPSCGVGAERQAAAGELDDPADVKPTLLDARASYLQVPAAGSYPRQQGYVPAWYQGYGWGVTGGSDHAAGGGGGYYAASSVYSDAHHGVHSTSPPMHHILRGVYNTLQA